MGQSHLNAVPGDDGIEITNAVIEMTRQGLHSRYVVKRATLESVRSRSGTQAEVRIEAYGVQVFGEARTSPTQRERVTLGPWPIAVETQGEMSRSSIEELLRSEQLDETVKKRQREARNWLEGTYRRLVATLHERTAFTFSVLVLVVLGAGLGIVFRGAHAATAFGISFVPSLLVIILIVTGKQMAQNAGTFWLGLILMWSGIAAVGLLDWWTLTRWLRR
jgi:lipopolysaccharide export LptBFGC system permease protein LptF